MIILQCMGGWCTKREHCAHYHAPPVPLLSPAERLCGQFDTPEPLPDSKPVAPWQQREQVAA